MSSKPRGRHGESAGHRRGDHPSSAPGGTFTPLSRHHIAHATASTAATARSKQRGQNRISLSPPSSPASASLLSSSSKKVSFGKGTKAGRGAKELMLSQRDQVFIGQDQSAAEELESIASPPKSPGISQGEAKPVGNTGNKGPIHSLSSGMRLPSAGGGTPGGLNGGARRGVGLKIKSQVLRGSGIGSQRSTGGVMRKRASLGGGSKLGRR